MKEYWQVQRRRGKDGWINVSLRISTKAAVDDYLARLRRLNPGWVYRIRHYIEGQPNP